MKYYVILKQTPDPYQGLIECSYEYYMVLRMVRDIHDKNVGLIRRLLVLLLGDDFDEPVTEDILLKNYDYPWVTDRELNEYEKSGF